MSVKQQLSAFYVEQGLTGKHLRKAMQWDMRQVRKEIQRKRQGWAGPNFVPHSLMDLSWRSMASTCRFYWVHRDMGFSI